MKIHRANSLESAPFALLQGAPRFHGVQSLGASCMTPYVRKRFSLRGNTASLRALNRKVRVISDVLRAFSVELKRWHGGPAATRRERRRKPAPGHVPER